MDGGGGGSGFDTSLKFADGFWPAPSTFGISLNIGGGRRGGGGGGGAANKDRKSLKELLATGNKENGSGGGGGGSVCAGRLS